MQTTKITSASIRIALAYQYSTFEVAVNLENENGISNGDIETARKDVQLLATNAVNEYKALPDPNLKKAIANIENNIKKVKELAENIKPEKEADPKEIAEIAALPLYQPKDVQNVGKPKKATK